MIAQGRTKSSGWTKIPVRVFCVQISRYQVGGSSSQALGEVRSIEDRVCEDRQQWASFVRLPTPDLWQQPAGVADTRLVHHNHLCLHRQRSLYLLHRTGGPSGGKHSLGNLRHDRIQDASHSGGRNWSSSSFLPRNPSTLKQASLKIVCSPRRRSHTRVWKRSWFLGQHLGERPWFLRRRSWIESNVLILHRPRWWGSQWVSCPLQKWLNRGKVLIEGAWSEFVLIPPPVYLDDRTYIDRPLS
jgi:hypothetical protein